MVALWFYNKIRLQEFFLREYFDQNMTARVKVIEVFIILPEGHTLCNIMLHAYKFPVKKFECLIYFPSI